MILFLSFDGVLHPSCPKQPRLSRLPLLEQWLLQHPEVRLVISSKWRNEMNLDTLRKLFSPHLQQRIIGVTPVITRHLDDHYWRLSEIFDWMKHCTNDQVWLILDDGIFPDRFNRLVKCNPELGLTNHDIEKLSTLKQQLQAV